MSDSEIKRKVLNLQHNKKIIGLCHGVFDLLHYGHLLHFQSAKKKCDFLFVSITSDQFIKKGPNRPIHNEYERLHFLKSLNFIDFVFIAKGESGVDSINLIKPDIYFKGSDYQNNLSDKTKKIFREIDAVKKNKGKILYTNEKHMSSSKIINEQGLAISEKHVEFLKMIKKLINYEDIIQLLDVAKKKDKALVVGDLIVDKYVFGNVLGKSGKEPHMVFSRKSEEMYIGGSAIISNHLSDFVNKITLISDIGNEFEIKKLLNVNLKKNILHAYLQTSKNSKTCVKTRFVDTVSKYKLFGSYSIPSLDNKLFHRLLNNHLKKNIKKNDIIIIADYSNNFFDLNSLKKICKSKKFVCGMSQKNSNDSKFQTLTNLKNLDLLCINEGELRSEVKDKSNTIEFIARNFIKKNNLKYLVITKGIDGSILFDKKSNSYYCPSFNAKPVDKLGAGDSMLAILSVLLKNKTNPLVALFIASIVASSVVNNVGNKYTANRAEIDRSLEFILK
jgi:rfaE bifunctional protein kinase chain/domain/rfaE bifunctional protein nucleotidyltransferase chain/domain